MIKLKKIIGQLDAPTFEALEDHLLKNKGEKFLYVARSYRSGTTADNKIIEDLGLNSNSFYALKSRLYDKVQKYISLSTEMSVTDDITQKIKQVRDYCYHHPREISIAYLEKLEKDLIKLEMHNELLMVYSAFKKMHFKSERYFNYTQLYNKHIAFLISLEKAECILGDFNLILTQYICSKSSVLLEKLLFLRKEITHHIKLNPSKQVELIMDIINIELYLFCGGSDKFPDFDLEDALASASKKVDTLPDTSWQKSWALPLDYLAFEYYRGHNSIKATPYFEKLNRDIENLMLYVDVCVVSNFLVERIPFLHKRKEEMILLKDIELTFLADPFDAYSKVIFGLCRSVAQYKGNKVKEASNTLKSIINQYSFKDFFHINIEIKLTQAFYYIDLGEIDLAENLLKSVYRKIKDEDLKEYQHVLDVIKTMNLQIEKKNKDKLTDTFTLFNARNKGTYAILSHLKHDLELKYS